MQLQRVNPTRVLVTGSDGFLGKNFLLHLSERKDIECRVFSRNDDVNSLPDLVRDTDFIFHFAGVNRPQDPVEFIEGNVDLTCLLVQSVERVCSGSLKKPTIIYSSSAQGSRANAYGESKRMAEQCLLEHSKKIGSKVFIFRFPNIFGKWARPNYNSVVATFCHNISRNLPIHIHDAHAPLSLVYVDDVMSALLKIVDSNESLVDENGFALITPVYETTVGALANQLMLFRDGRSSLQVDHVGSGFKRALYATYISYLPIEEFAYEIPGYSDSRGTFVEAIKTPDCGQFSFFTALPGAIRGGHYHHSKIEKFLVIKGQALFRFRHMQTGQMHQIESSGESPKIVETIPGWTHDVVNTGTEEMIALLWANEVFDHQRPDTQRCPIQ